MPETQQEIKTKWKWIRKHKKLSVILAITATVPLIFTYAPVVIKLFENNGDNYFLPKNINNTTIINNYFNSPVSSVDINEIKKESIDIQESSHNISEISKDETKKADIEEQKISIPKLSEDIVIISAEPKITKTENKFNVVPPPKPQINLVIHNARLKNGTVGKKYNDNLKIKDNISGVKWNITSGKLPDGLSLKNDGNITGTPKSEGTYTFTVTASKTGAKTAQKNFSIKIVKEKETKHNPVTPPVTPKQPKPVPSRGMWKLEASGSGRKLGVTLQRNGNAISGRNRGSTSDDPRDHFVFNLSDVTVGQKCEVSSKVIIKNISGGKLQGNIITFTQNNTSITTVRKN